MWKAPFGVNGIGGPDSEVVVTGGAVYVKDSSRVLYRFSVPGAAGHRIDGDRPDHTLAVASDATVWATGDNPYGQLGTGDTTGRTTPQQIAGLTNVVAVAAGYRQLGDGTTTTGLRRGAVLTFHTLAAP